MNAVVAVLPVQRLTLAVGGQCGQLLLVAPSAPECQLCTLDGLSCRSVDRHISQLVVGQRKHQCAHIAHVEEHALHLGGGLCVELQHVNADGKSLQRHGVFEDFIGFFAYVCASDGYVGGFQQWLNVLVTLIIVGVTFHVCRCFYAVDAHGDAADAPEVGQFHGLRLVGNGHGVLYLCLVFLACQLVLGPS